MQKRGEKQRKGNLDSPWGREEALREENKIAGEAGGGRYGRMMEIGRKICLWQEKGNQTSSLLTRAHRDGDGGEIKS